MLPLGISPFARLCINALLLLSLLRQADAFEIAWYHAVPDSSVVCFFTTSTTGENYEGHGPVAFKGMNFSTYSGNSPMYVEVGPGKVGKACSWNGNSLIGGEVEINMASSVGKSHIFGFAPTEAGGVELRVDQSADAVASWQSRIMLLNLGVGLTCDMQAHIPTNDYVLQSLHYSGGIFTTSTPSSGSLHLAYTCQELGWGGSLKMSVAGGGPLCAGAATAFVLVGKSPCYDGDSYAPEVLVVPGVPTSSTCYPNSVASATSMTPAKTWTCPPSATLQTSTTALPAGREASVATSGGGLLLAMASVIASAAAVR